MNWFRKPIVNNLETPRKQRNRHTLYVEFGREKEMLFDRWCLSKNVNKEYVQLRQLVLIENFKNCLPTELKTYIVEQMEESLQEAAVLVDDYALTHKPVFNHSGDGQPRTVTKSNPRTVSASSGGSQTSGSNSSNLLVCRSPRFSTGPTCYYCKKKGHVMSKC